MATQRDREVHLAENGSLNGGYVRFGRSVQTTDATATVLLSIPLAEGEAVSGRAIITGSQDDETDALGAVVEFAARRASAGNVTLVGTAARNILESTANTDITVAANTTDQVFEIRVTGIAAENWRWEGFVDFVKV